MTTFQAASDSAPQFNVIELNRYAPRPFVFTEAGLCLRDSLRAAGFASNLLVNEHRPGFPSIVLGAPPRLQEFVNELESKDVAIFNLEQLGSHSTLADRAYRQWLGQHFVLDYHSRNIANLEQENGPSQLAFEVPIAPGPSLAVDSGSVVEKTVDVLFFGSRNQRRMEVISRLEAAGVSTEIVAGAYGKELTPAIRRARLVLHVHFYETALFPITRILQPVVLGVPIVCESSEFSRLSDWSNSGIRFAEYEALVDVCGSLLASENEREAIARRTLQFSRGLDFSDVLRHIHELMCVRAQSVSMG